MKKLMIIGAGVYQVPIIKKAKDRGLYTIAVSPYGDYPGLKVADKTYDLDVRDKEGILAAARDERIDGITTDQTDMAMPAVAYVAEKLGLPGIGYECATLFTDKYKMREKSMQLGLPTIRYRSVTTCQEAEEFFNEVDTSIMIKPVDNQGSRGVYRIDNISQLRYLFPDTKGYSANGMVIAEQYVEGDEYEVDSIVIDGREHTLMCGDIALFSLPDVFSSKTRMYPSARNSETVARLLKLNRDTVEGFGLKQGLTHSEYVVDKSGQPYLIEAAARGGGAFVSSDITPLQTGLDTAEYLIDAALGIPFDAGELGYEMCHCGTISFYLPEGKVASVDGIEEAKALPYIHGNLLNEIYIGKITGAFSDKTARYISVLSADTREELETRFNHYRKIINVRVETPFGLQGPIWE